MILTVEQLKFLKTFVDSADTKTQLADKIFIHVKDNVARFVQFSSDLKLFYEMPVRSKDFTLLISTTLLWSLIKTFPDTKDVTITETGIDFDKDESSYTFDTFDIPFPDISKFLASFQTKANSFMVKSLDKLRMAMPYCGQDGFEVISIMDNHFVASNRAQSAILETDNLLEVGPTKCFYFPKSVAALWSSLGKPEIELIDHPNYFVFNYDGINCVAAKDKRYALPYMFSPTLDKKFSHSTSIKVAKKEFLDTLKRMSVFVYKNPNTRIYMTADGNRLLIENRDFNKSKEKVEVIACSPTLQGTSVCISCTNLMSAIQSLTGKEITIQVSDKMDNKIAVTVTDEDAKNKFILVLSK